MKKYESLFILDVRKVEDEGNALSKEFIALVEGWGGKITAADAMGRLQSRTFLIRWARRTAFASLTLQWQITASCIPPLMPNTLRQ